MATSVAVFVVELLQLGIFASEACTTRGISCRLRAMKVFTYKNCSTCKKATKWLNEQGVAFDEVAIRDTPPSVAELRQMLAYQADELRKLFNTAGGDYRQLNMKDKLPSMTVDDALALLASRGNLVKRPFLLGDGVGLVGFKEADWAQALGR
jgi:arsenate reductase